MREIGVTELAERLASGEPTWLVDVREPWEVALVAIAGSRHVPLGELAGRAYELTPPEGTLVVTVCHHGVRSLQAAAIVERAVGGQVASLAGGIDAWARVVDPGLARY